MCLVASPVNVSIFHIAWLDSFWTNLVFTPMFISALFTVTKTGKQLKCPLIEDRIKKMWYMYAREHYSAIREDEILPSMTTLMVFKNIMLSKLVSQKKLRTI